MNKLMTLEELGEYLRFSRRTIYRLLKEGDIPGIKIGNKWRFDKDVLDKWLQIKAEGARAHILVIDDDQFIRALFEEILKKLGHMVATASTSAEGIRYVKEHDFDLVFLDLKMPEMDGAEIFRQIKIIKPRQPVIIITGYPESDMMARALTQGPFGVMNKPFGEPEIVNAVDTFLKARTK